MSLAEQIEHLLRRGAADEAIQLLERRSANGNGEADLILGQWYVAGIHLPRDFAAAKASFERSLRNGCSAAEQPLLALLARGPGNCSRDWPTTLQRLARLGRTDNKARREANLIAAMDLNDNGDPQQDHQPEFLSRDPLIVRFRSFLSVSECDALIDLAKPKLVPAQVVHPETGQLVNDRVRTSCAAAFPLLDETPMLHAINRRIAAASRSRYEQGEPAQVLAYAPGQQYHLHSDALIADSNQRIQTFLIYLTDDFTGGATYFPHGDQTLRPARGDAICWSNVDSAMRPVKSAIHAGLPVTQGTKYVLSRWIRLYPLDLGANAKR